MIKLLIFIPKMKNNNVYNKDKKGYHVDDFTSLDSTILNEK